MRFTLIVSLACVSSYAPLTQAAPVPLDFSNLCAVIPTSQAEVFRGLGCESQADARAQLASESKLGSRANSGVVVRIVMHSREDEKPKPDMKAIMAKIMAATKKKE